MAAVVRLKRRCDEEPLEALLLACKRKKLDDDLPTTETEKSFTTILKFAGTLKDQEEDVASHIGKILRKGKTKFDLRCTTDVTGKLRTEKNLLAQENRLKVVNCFRDLKDSDVLESEKEATISGEDGEKSLTIVDVVSHLGKESNSLPSESQAEVDPGDGSSGPDVGYVYDLYYTSVAGSDGLVNLDNLLSVHPLAQSDWVYHEDSSDMSPDEQDEDDSNDENNWRNDYPDSDHSIDEDDMRMAVQMGDLNLGDGEDLSSDNADEDFVYGVSVDPEDVTRYGLGYADWKARMQRGGEDSEDDECNQDHSSDEEEDPTGRFM